MQPVTNQNLIDIFDITAQIDANKIFLFKTIKHNFKFDISEELNEEYNKINKIINNIRKNDFIGLYYLNDNIITAPVSELEFWVVLVYENTTADYKIQMPKKDTNNKTNFWFISIDNLKRIFEFIPS